MKGFLLLFILFSEIAIASELTVSAASSLQDAVKEISKTFQKENPEITVYTNFASSGKLRAQIEKGAPVDIFLSASPKHIDILEKTGMILPDSRVNFASNSLVLVRPLSNPKVWMVKELTSKSVTKIAVGTPSSVPAGQYAKDALVSLKLWDKLIDKFVYGASVRQVLDYIVRDEVDAGVVYSTDAKKQESRVRVIARFEAGLHTPILYPMAVIKRSKNVNDAKKFARFVTSEVGMSILSKYGFGNGK